MLSSGMEPDIKKYLAKLLNSMSVVLLWLLINAMLGIYLEWAFFDDGISLVNIIFYWWPCIDEWHMGTDFKPH